MKTDTENTEYQVNHILLTLNANTMLVINKRHVTVGGLQNSRDDGAYSCSFGFSLLNFSILHNILRAYRMCNTRNTVGSKEAADICRQTSSSHGSSGSK